MRARVPAIRQAMGKHVRGRVGCTLDGSDRAFGGRRRGCDTLDGKSKVYKKLFMLFRKCFTLYQPQTQSNPRHHFSPLLSFHIPPPRPLVIRKYDKAEPLSERALTIHEEVLGSEHLDTAYSLKSDKEEPLHQHVSISENAVKPEHPDTADKYPPTHRQSQRLISPVRVLLLETSQKNLTVLGIVEPAT
ncbi:hypothetical protein BC936DRAFT_142233 [Jimgerdemannia flammicorona]|uniref:Uncharacterized protein n=1 Tax=Jimgerdemannia flammicorona TaxID=994334 RepID=A0A433DFC9_9FUNG|nr:hypothetical protein BC936DRAFT_142233 [Jimgerdemannia flammicorona]